MLFSSKKKLQDLSATSIQVVINQLLSLAIFYLLSAYLSKTELGEMNWSIATVSVILAILSFGLDPVIVKKIAAGNNAPMLLKMQVTHTLITGGAFLVLLFLIKAAFPQFFTDHPYLTGFAISLVFTYFSTAYKQLVQGLERFRNLALMAASANVMRSILLAAVLLANAFSIQAVLIIFIFSALFEWMFSAFLAKAPIRDKPVEKWNQKKYYQLLHESLPQLGVIVFNAAVARFDWILMGLLSTAVATADYTFAYKILELGTLPILILSFVLLPRMSRVLHIEAAQNTRLQNDLALMVRLEMVIATFIPLVLNIMWIPLMNIITRGKYGAANADIFFILSLCLPFLYFINYCWTLSFVRGQLKKIMMITIIVFAINLLLDVLLIPHWHGKGAAMAYLIAVVIQFALYAFMVRKDVYRPLMAPLVKGFGCFALAYTFAIFLSSALMMQLLIGSVLFIFCLFVFSLLRISDLRALKQVLRN